jgi:hypothetical protein
MNSLSKDLPIHTLKYWMEDKGIVETFHTYFPNLARTDPIIRRCLLDIKIATSALNLRVEELTKKDENEEE